MFYRGRICSQRMYVLFYLPCKHCEFRLLIGFMSSPVNDGRLTGVVEEGGGRVDSGGYPHLFSRLYPTLASLGVTHDIAQYFIIIL